MAHHVGGPAWPSTHLRIRLSGLVTGGVYSAFYGTIGPDSEHPLCPGVEQTLPLTAQPEADARSIVVHRRRRRADPLSRQGRRSPPRRYARLLCHHLSLRRHDVSSVAQPGRVLHPGRRLPEHLRRGRHAPDHRLPEILASRWRGSLACGGGLSTSAAVAGAGLLALLWSGQAESLWELFSDREEIRQTVDDAASPAPIAYLSLLVGQAVVAPLPALAMVAAGGYTFGVLEQFVLAWIGSLLGNAGCFALSRAFGRGLTVRSGHAKSPIATLKSTGPSRATIHGRWRARDGGRSPPGKGAACPGCSGGRTPTGHPESGQRPPPGGPGRRRIRRAPPR